MAWEILFMVWVVALGLALYKFGQTIIAIQDHRHGIDHPAHGDD
ncbi:MAG TPA: hypothetical protein VFN57_04195 [Thermomicrobiaceae bacterium]|nr:hypothetical protein [Thermomicrobiaceae bacterium]